MTMLGSLCTCTTYGRCELCATRPAPRSDTGSDLTPIQAIDPFPIPDQLTKLLDSPTGKSALHRLAKRLHTDDWTAFLAIRFFLFELEDAPQ